MENKPTIIIVNDNHFEVNNGKLQFRQSKFHLFLNGFLLSEVLLSSPSLNKFSSSDLLSIDGINVLPRIGYGKAFSFYASIPLHFIKYFRGLFRHIRNSDVVLLVSPACTLPISYLICRIQKKPIVLYVVGDHMEVIDQDKSSHKLIQLIKKITAKWEWIVTKYISQHHITFALGHALYEKLSTGAYGLYPGMTSLVRDESVVSPKFKKLKSTIKLLTVSRLSKEKGIGVALRAISNLNEKFSITYTIVGDGPEKGELMALVSDLGLEPYVHFTGYLEQKEIYDKYLESDIFILPSLSEGIPKVILDAMATSSAIISTDVGGIPDLLTKDQQRGWIVEPGNVAELESAICDCIENDEKRFSKISSSNDYITQHTLEKEAARVESELLKLARINK